MTNTVKSVIGATLLAGAYAGLYFYLPSSVPHVAATQLPAFQYPPHPEHYTFTLHVSDDLQTWSDVATFQPHAQPSGIYDIVGNGNHKFYRMKGNP